MGRVAQLFRHWFLHAQRLFHMLVGGVFLFLAIGGVTVSFSEWRYYQHAPYVGATRFGLIVGFTVLLIILSLYSFVKARSVR